MLSPFVINRSVALWAPTRRCSVPSGGQAEKMRWLLLGVIVAFSHSWRGRRVHLECLAKVEFKYQLATAIDRCELE